MAHATRLISAEEFSRMSNEGDLRQELIRGEVKEMPPPGGMHGYSMGNVSAELALHARRQKLGFVFVETGFLLEQNPDTVRAPDCAFVSARRLPGGRIPGGYIPLAPDLAVEVVSQWSRPRALDAKARAWLAAGTRLVWIIDPEKRTATVHRPGAAKQVLREPDFLDGEDVVPGFRVALADLLPPAA